MKGPRVSGPWLDSRGSNGNALRPGLYTRNFPSLLLCGPMFPWKLSFAGDVAAWWESDATAMRPSCGHGVH